VADGIGSRLEVEENSILNTPVGRLLAALLILIGGNAVSADRSLPSITVADDGHTGTVRRSRIACTMVPTVLTKDLGLKLTDAVRVSPESCGHAATVKADAVAEVLEKAGFTKVYVVAFITAPNTACGE
jgi:hypothetical protein